MRAISLSAAISAGTNTIVSPLMRTTISLLEERHVDRFIAALARRVLDRFELDRGRKPDASDVDDMGRAFERVNGSAEFRFQRGRARTDLLAVEVERGKACGGRERMAGVGVAVEEIDRVRRFRLERS